MAACESLRGKLVIDGIYHWALNEECSPEYQHYCDDEESYTTGLTHWLPLDILAQLPIKPGHELDWHWQEPTQPEPLSDSEGLTQLFKTDHPSDTNSQSPR